MSFAASEQSPLPVPPPEPPVPPPPVPPVPPPPVPPVPPPPVPPLPPPPWVGFVAPHPTAKQSKTTPRCRMGGQYQNAATEEWAKLQRGGVRNAAPRRAEGGGVLTHPRPRRLRRPRPAGRSRSARACAAPRRCGARRGYGAACGARRRR